MSKIESADLIIKLYELRREKKMRKARNWFFGFNPKSADEIIQAMMDPKTGPYFRMVTTYWDMAAAFVNHEAIDAAMFHETAGEHVIVFAKIEPFLTELREKFGSGEAFKHLEKVIMSLPDGAERVKKTQERLRSIPKQKADEGEHSSEASA